MSENIHGFGGSSNNNNDNNYKPVQMMGSVDNSSANPREETFFSFIKGVSCPYFTYKSVIFAVSCVDLIMYVITLCFGIKMDAIELLAPTYNTLDTFGMKVNKLSWTSMEMAHFWTFACKFCSYFCKFIFTNYNWFNDRKSNWKF